MTSALTIGLPVSIPLVAYGGTPPYIYSIASGLPAGLSLNAATGLVSGTPTTVQSSTALEWSVTDSATPTPATATDTFLVVVQAVPVAVPFYSFPVASAGRWRFRGAFEVIDPEPVTVGLALGSIGIGAEVEVEGPTPSATVGFALGGIGIGASVEAVQPLSAIVGLALGSVGIGASVEAVQPLSATVGLSLGGVGIGAALASTVSATVGLSLGGVGIGIGASVAGSLDLTGLQSWWTLNETTGNRLDSHGANNLTPGSAGVSSLAGKIGNAATFTTATTNNTYLQLTATQGYNLFSNTFYLSLWINPREYSTNIHRACGIYVGAGTNDSRFYLNMRSDGVMQFRLRQNNGSLTDVQSSASLSLDIWSLVEIYYDHVGLQTGIAINRGSFATASPPVIIAQTTGSRLFVVGNETQTNTSGSFPGAIDEISVWNTLPTEDRRDYLYNAGAGNTFPT